MIRQRWPVYVVLGLLILISGVFIVEFIIASGDADAVDSVIDAEQLAALLTGRDAANGPALVQSYGCAACHITGSAMDIAPAFDGVATRAQTRRPGLTAEAYIYESIVNPTAFVVEDYSPAMPVNYADRLSDAELGDIIVWLLEQK